MRVATRILVVCLFALLACYSNTSAAVKVDAGTFGAIEARSIGPATMSGRILAIDAVAKEPRILYVGAASGGVWKSINSGTTFKPVFEKNPQSIGALAIDQSKPETVWVGTGEADTRNSVSLGAGIFKTNDGGENWQLMGLEKSERISKIVIDPKNSDIVYVAVPGNLWNASEDRGLYKTIDGGKTWNKILYINADTGCSDVSMDQQDTNVLYASTWQFRRKPYFFNSGGAGSGIHKSTDAGQTWKKLTKGLPEGDLGRIAVEVAPSRNTVVYATVEAAKTYMYRSDDAGETWQRVNNSFNVQARPFYFSHVVVDPKDHNRVYKPGFTLASSSDGGVSFKDLGDTTHSDHHALWVNPNDPFQLVLGTDGGIYASYDRGNTWAFRRNLPVSQFYHVMYDMEQPYNVYGGLQDNGSWTAPSQGTGGVKNSDWKNVGFGDGFHTWPDLSDKNIVFAEFQGGKLLRFHKNTGELKGIQPFPAEGEADYRFNWNTPIEISEKNSAMYVGSQFVHRSTDKGESWVRISPDLTTNNPEWQKQGDSGGLTIDNSTAENHCTVFTIGASPLDENVIWAGTDDGNVQVTTDGGKSWSNVTANVTGLPKNTWVSTVEPGSKERGTAFASFDGHQTGDMKPYVYRTTDFGKTWTALANESIKSYAHVVRQDRENPNLLFVGTEMGLYLSVDGGLQWAQFTGNLPNVSIRDIAIHPRDSDVILATHGRGVYIIDDITPLRHIDEKVLESKVAFLPTAPSVLRFPRISQDFPGDDEYVGRNEVEAASIVYYLKDRQMFGDMKLEIYDAEGKLVTSMPAGKRKGINRVPWFMRMKAPRTAPSPQLTFGGPMGPTVPEGVYTVRLIKGEEKFETKITLAPDPTVQHPDADRKLQQDTTMKLYRMQERLAFVADSITDVRDQARERAGKLKKGDSLAKSLNGFADHLNNLHKTLVATREGFLTGEEQLREKVVWLYLLVSIYAGKPTNSVLDRAALLEKQIEKANAEYETIVGKELDVVNAKLSGKKMEPLKLLTKEEWDKRQN